MNRGKMSFVLAAITILFGILVFFSEAQVFSEAQAQGMKPTPALRRACGPDARKLCASVISNTAKRQACMRAHRAELSEACLAAIQRARTSR
jgi:hypothetical protein